MFSGRGLRWRPFRPQYCRAGHIIVARCAQIAHLFDVVSFSIHGPLEVSTPSLETDFLGPEMNRHTPQDSPDSATRGPQGNFHMADATQHPNNERLEKPQYWHKTAQRSHEPTSQWPLHSLIFNALCCLSFAFRCSLQWFALSYIALHGHCIKFSR